MQYNVQLLNISRIPLGTQGVVQSICTRCSNPTCSNPIEWKKISIFGINYKERVFIKGRDLFFIVSCPEGFIDKDLELVDEQDNESTT